MENSLSVHWVESGVILSTIVNAAMLEVVVTCVRKLLFVELHTTADE